MKYLIFGEDTYRSGKQISVMKQKFIDGYGRDNLVVKKGAELDGVNLENILFAQTLLGGDRLVVFEDVLAQASDEVRQELTKIIQGELPNDLTVVFYEAGKVDRRLLLFKVLNKSAKVEEFRPLAKRELVGEAKNMMVEKRVMLSDWQMSGLLERTSDLWQLHNELDKLSAFGLGKPITNEQFQQLVGSSADANTFALLDAISVADMPTANRILNQALRQGENEIRMLGSIAYQLRNLIRIKDMSESGVKPNIISQRAGIHPFVVQKTLSQIRHLSRRKIISAYQKLVKTDWQIKTGVYKASDALDLLVAELTNR
ncbi:DNA polymerase III subunit delta [candidate division Kazan bacterium]|uniref:DNA polymerase III subunit delta n=1 Tax=candidate division Kazan bacterium TaxID=2202143 RepID=A0A420ZDN1_UNCK3|nr:MAG: DNA polymerase III subunit delta [candidate division Kazan bacterium]